MFVKYLYKFSNLQTIYRNEILVNIYTKKHYKSRINYLQMNLKLLSVLLFSSFGSIIAQVVMTNNIPAKLPVGSDVEVEVKINKGSSISNFTKYHMDVPNGMDVSEVDSRTGNFTFENNRVKIVWVSVPGEPEFAVKFRVHINTQAPFKGTIIQKFYFLDGGVKKEVEAAPITIEFGSGTPVTSNTSPKTVNATGTQNSPAASPESKPVVKEEKVVQPAVVPSIVPGLTYRIQIASSPTDPGKAKYASLGNALKIVNESGSFKVQYGDYASKEEAIKAKNELSAKGYDGFLVKYQDGIRTK